MDLISGYPFWLIKSGLPFDYPLLTQDASADVVILGGGISGALMAYHLGEAGVSCIVIDKRTIGLGSTCASTSLLQYEIDVPLSDLQKKIGDDDAVKAYRLSSDAIDKLEEIAARIGFNGFHRKQSLYFSAGKKDVNFIKEEFRVRKESGFDVELLDRRQIQESFFIDAPAAILSSQAAETNAYAFTHALHQYNISKGVKVFDRTDAVQIDHSAGGVEIVTNRGHRLRTGKLIYANGYEAVNYVHEKIVSLTSTYAICSEQMLPGTLGMNPGALYWNTDVPYLYMRNTPDQRLIIGGRDEPFYNPEKRDKLLAKKAKLLSRDCKRLLDIDFKMEFAWTGTFGATKDGLPFIGPYKKLPNSYFALGFGGNGITFSLIAAAFLTDMVKGIKNDSLKLFAFSRT